MMTSSAALRVRWLMGAMGRNRLVRASDRVEALSVLIILAAALFAIPMAQREGDEAYVERIQLIAAQQQSRHSVRAIAQTDSSSPSPRRSLSSVAVRVEWPEGQRRRSEVVTSPSFVKAGAPVTVWLDDTGSVVSAPDRPEDAKTVATSRAWGMWVGIVGFCTLVALVLRRRLDRHRTESWQREWTLLAYDDDGWANHDR
ncbi:hypothetical protein H7K45_25975 [Mycobacterium yunnanensis]|uniref:Transmembrane protein n=1 Tax=Mycobacterium yunnanensis TaxID=368477 RepID=A0A9X2ZA39_9MYCO|nr:hypothetical protein [Mycobacterium yunnanensis]MCV7424007.1 hypothetical protein [Mycobacterium yunnanensis]